jgi:subtilisin family serine protease
MHADAQRLRILIVPLMVALLCVPAALPAVSVPDIGEPDPTVIDPHLAQVMKGARETERIEIIVRFDGSITPADRDVLEDLGVHVYGSYHIVPAVHASATSLQLERLSGYERTERIEYDVPMDYLMDMTTAVVNATSAWRSVIEGSLWGSTGITGKGVTAVVLDTGVDAGHPDLDYGTKTIRNLKSDTGTGPWYEIENGDTSSGHGTHVAGTVAGNGDASAGGKAGVAPEANLIGLSTGEAGAITGAVGALQWVYDHSKPGNNPYNIRVVSNSWGAGGGIYEPGDTISEAINRLVYENNVVSVFAAGNSGGDGSTIQSGNYANTPAAICVAAAGRDGSYITDFSSKGRWDWLDTYPDIAAPGHHIDSTAARRTQISAMTQQGDSNPYYLSISGTSMATPHVSGLVALLWQAAPSMRVSEIHQDAGIVTTEAGGYDVIPPEEMTEDSERYNEEYSQWNERLDTRIHEAELIIKLTGDMIPFGSDPDPDANNLTDNAIPDWSVPGYAGFRTHDWAQGYGLMNVHRAVGLALTLERLRWDDPSITVLDAYMAFEDVFEKKEIVEETDRIKAKWSGEWSRFNEQPSNPGLIFSANQTKFVYVPEGAEQMVVSMAWPPLDFTKIIAGTLGFKIDYDNNGGWDYQSSVSPSRDGTRVETVPVSGNGGQYWRFGIEGQGIQWNRIFEKRQYEEIRMEYEISVSITFPQFFNDTATTEIYTTDDYLVGNISMVKYVYNLNNVSFSKEVEPPIIPEEGGGSFWLWLLVVFVVLLVFAFVVAKMWPESAPGREIRRMAFFVGVDTVIGTTKRITRRGVRKVRSVFVRKKPEKAELVAEEQSPAET